MRRVALKGLWLRRGRALLTTVAVVLGVAMVCGTYILTDTIDKAFGSIFASANAKTSAVVTARGAISEASSGLATLPDSVLDDVRAVDGVADAVGTVDASGFGTDQLRLVIDGRVVGNENAPKLGVGADFGESERLSPFTLEDGEYPDADREVVLLKDLAADEGLAVGDTIGVSGTQGTEDFEIVGIARFGDVGSLGGATFGLFDLETGQRLLDKEGRLSSVSVAAAGGVPDAQLKESLEGELGDEVRVRTGDEQAAADSEDIEEALAFIRYFLLAFGFIALGVGAFVIYNTLTITVAQRVRELATLRALGATGRQVRRSVLIEGLVLGVLASAVGLVVGYFLARGLSSLFVALGIDLPQTDQVVKLRTVIASVAIGVVVTAIASIAPARRATRISPVAAMQEGAKLPAKLGSRRPLWGVAVLAIAAALLGIGAFGGGDVGFGLILIGIGTLVLFAGVAMLAHRVVTPLAAWLGAPARRFAGAAGHLARENATRNPARTASTAGALMIGLALVTLVATLGEGLRSSSRDAVQTQVRAPFVVVSGNGFDTVPRGVGEAIAKLEGAEVYPLREDRARAFGEALTVNGVARGSGAVTNLEVEPGPGEAVLERAYASDEGLAIGDRFTLTGPDGRQLDLTVAGLQTRTAVQNLDPVLGKVIISLETFDENFPRPGDQFVFVAGDTTLADIEGAVAAFPDVEADTRADFITARVDEINGLLGLLYVLLALSVIVSLFGMVNTLVLTVFERTREIGMLRAVGMSRRQVRRMVRHESIITALIGAALGLPLGVALAALMAKALESEGVTFVLPVGALITFTIVAIIAGILAAIAPARRAARLDVLRALQYE